jgi:allene oxide cyclase-like protein
LPTIRSLRIARATLAALAATLAMGPPALAASSRQEAVKTLQYGVRFIDDAEYDLGAPGPSAGDQRTFYDVLVDREGRHVGYSGGSCAVESVSPPVFSCTVTFSLPGGQLATQLLTTPGAAPKPLAVTGGTGAYRYARGEGTLVEYGKRTGRVTFHLRRAEA